MISLVLVSQNVFRVRHGKDVGAFKDSDPEIFIRGKETYQTNLNPSNPSGTLQSIDAVLRSLDRRAEDERLEIEQNEKKLADFKTQLGRPFEHEARLNELMVKQAQLNASLDLDKSETQVIADRQETDEKSVCFAGRLQAANRVAEIAV